MNRYNHEDLTKVACWMAGIHETAAGPIIDNSSAPDYLVDVLCRARLGQPTPDLFGQRLAGLCHFQRPGGLGYCWDDDKSLGPAESFADAGIHVAGMTVVGTSVPMVKACGKQPGAALDGFVFPPASEVGAFYASLGVPVFLGMACHFAQDACIPHHAWGALRWGHQTFENQLENQWYTHRRMAKESSDPKACTGLLREQVESVVLGATTVEELIASNAEWACAYFNPPGLLDSCNITQALAVCTRAIASTMKLISLATKAGG